MVFSLRRYTVLMLNIFEKIVIGFLSVWVTGFVLSLLVLLLGLIGMIRSGWIALIFILLYLVGWVWGSIWCYRKLSDRYLSYRIRKDGIQRVD